MARIGYCPEADAFYSWMTGLEFVTSLLQVSGFGKKDAVSMAEESLRLLDMTDAMNEAAREAAARAGHANIEIRKGLIEDLPVEDASVDWVISNCVINLSPRKHEVFREIHRVLKPGGRLSISDIVAQDLPDWIRESAAAYIGCVAGAISEEDYLRGLRDAGLSDVEIQERLAQAGVQVLEARISHLAYAPEIAAAMLQRQQASAVVAARQKIVEGAVGMVEHALEQLSSKRLVELDEERKAQMVSNLLVVLCSEHETQPVVNTGSLYA